MLNNDPKISFVMPAYNCERTIEESVESIMAENWSEGDELIIVNDGSTDRTGDVIAKLCRKYPRVKSILNEKNIGCPATRNVGIRAASNALIFNMDADDVLVPGSVQKLKRYMLENNADIAAFGEIHFFKDKTSRINSKWMCKTGLITLADYLAGPTVPGGNYLYTKASWQKIGGYWEYGKGLHEFWGFSLKQLGNGSKMVAMPNSHYFHRYGTGNSLFVRESKKGKESSLMATRMIMNFIDQIHDEDAAYIMSEQGSGSWFDSFFSRPVRVKGGRAGITGYVVKCRTAPTLLSRSARIVKAMIRPAKKTADALHSYASYIRNYRDFKASNDGRFRVSWGEKKMMLSDKIAETPFDAHYILHPAWAARIIAILKPQKHVDISSTLSFCTIVSAFVPVDFYDYRPAHLHLSGLNSNKADLTDLPFKDDSIKSLSCMHTIEHIGLGRYGDPIDPQGDLKAIAELRRVTAKGGTLLFVVPIGKPRLLFNAHRIYSYDQIASYFADFHIKEFTLIPDNARKTGMIPDARKELADNQDYGCGCFWLIKK